MSENLDSVLKIKKYIEGYYNEIHVSVLGIGKNKMARLRSEFGITHKKMDRIFFENYLVEKGSSGKVLIKMITIKFNHLYLIGTEHSRADFSNFQKISATSRFNSIIF